MCHNSCCTHHFVVLKLSVYEDSCARNSFLRQGQVIASHRYCGTQLLVPALDTCFWHTRPHIACSHTPFKCAESCGIQHAMQLFYHCILFIISIWYCWVGCLAVGFFLVLVVVVVVVEGCKLPRLVVVHLVVGSGGGSSISIIIIICILFGLFHTLFHIIFCHLIKSKIVWHC